MTLEDLRAPFPPSAVARLPRIWCDMCWKAPTRACVEHPVATCNECGNTITVAHRHFDYVGHAQVTDRLLSVDPHWTWEPLGTDEQGLPAIVERDGMSELWVRLTICGVTRIGVGTCPSSTMELSKQLISDALRNAAMRFGVALDTWARSELESAGGATAGRAAAGRNGARGFAGPDSLSAVDDLDLAVDANGKIHILDPKPRR